MGSVSSLANDPKTRCDAWEDLKAIKAPGALDRLTKELIYFAVSITSDCEYCTVSHTAAGRRAGMTKEMREELIAVIGMATITNHLVNAYRVESDPHFIEAASTLQRQSILYSRAALSWNMASCSASEKSTKMRRKVS